MNLQEIVTKKYNKGIADCSNEELYFALLEMTKAMAEKKENHNGKKKIILYFRRVLNWKTSLQQPD